MKSRSIQVALILGVLLTMFAAGCKSDPMKGTWKMQAEGAMAGMMDGNIEFDGAGKCTMTMNIDAMGKKESHVAEGTYKLEGKELTLTILKSDGKDATETEKKPETMTLSDDMKSFSSAKMMGLKFVKQ